jgi:LIM domain kinase 1
MNPAASDLLRKINSLDPHIFNIDYKDLENVKQIGGGNFGQVSKGTYFGTEVAIKQLLDVDDKDMHKYIEREMATLRDMRHPNVVQFMGLSRNMTDVYIVTEYIPGGDLRKLLKDEAKELSWLLRAKIATDVAYAMTFLHSKGLIHRDLKSNNLLVGENWKVKVCDFGFSRRVNKGELMTLCGTDEWMAPEVMCGDKYDEKADVFSFAMVVTELITRKKPPLRKPATGFCFEAESFRTQIPPDCPPEFIDLACLCAEQLAEKRPHFKEVLPKLKALVAKLEAEEAQKKKDAPPPEKHHKKHHKTKSKDRKDETPEEKAKRRDDRKRRKAEKAAKEGKTVEELDKEKRDKKKKAS